MGLSKPIKEPTPFNETPIKIIENMLNPIENITVKAHPTLFNRISFRMRKPGMKVR